MRTGKPIGRPKKKKGTRIRGVQLDRPLDAVVEDVLGKGHKFSDLCHYALYALFAPKHPDFFTMVDSIEIRTGLDGAWNDKAGAAKS